MIILLLTITPFVMFLYYYTNKCDKLALEIYKELVESGEATSEEIEIYNKLK